MNEDRMKILEMLSEGKLTPQEAEKLLDALGGPTQGGEEVIALSKNNEKCLYVVVRPKEGSDSKDKVTVRIPFTLLKAGINIMALMPKEAKEKIDSTLKEKKAAFNIDDINPENIQEFIDAVEDMSIDVEDEDSYVKVYCR